MKALGESLRKATDVITNKGESMIELQGANIEWSAYCVRELRGALLKKGLNICIALSDFNAELENPTD